MGGEWQTLSLADVYDFSSGLSKPRSEFGSGHPFLSFKDVFYNSAVPKQLTELVQSTEQERASCSVRRGDVFLTRTSETMDELGMSSVALADIPDATFNGFTKRLRPKQELIAPGFARYFFRSSVFRAAVNSMATMSTRASLNNEMLERLTITFPNYSEQESIAHILGTLDDKIELSRRRNQILEAIARALFQDWFVDFGPVRAKMEGREPYLPADLWQLFPDRLDDEGKPEGWESGRLDDALILQRGFDLPASDRKQGAYPVMAASGVNGYHDRFMVKAPGITTGRSGVLGRVFFVQTDFWPLNTSLWVKEFKKVTPLYAFELLRGLDFEMFNAGSAVPTLNRNHVHNLPIILPPRKLIEVFDGKVAPMRRAQKQNEDEGALLEKLRDTLLPRLISGELRVADTGKFMERTDDQASSDRGASYDH